MHHKNIEYGSQGSQTFLKVDDNCNLNVKRADRILLERTGATRLDVHACVGCDNHVYLPTDADRRCPKCQHSRFNSKGQPNEVMIMCVTLRVLSQHISPQ